MTTKQLPEPQRWTDRLDGDASAEAMMGAALRRARAATTPSDALCARIELERRDRATVFAAHPRWRVAVVTVAALLAVGGSVGAAREPLRAWAARHGFLAPAPAPAAPVARVARVRAARVAGVREPEVAPIEPIEPIEAPPSLAEALSAGAAPTKALAPAPSALRSGVAPVALTPAAEEARLLEGVFRALRTEARAAAALEALDDYERRFPAGLLRGEARLARVEALLALGSRADALALLDRWDAASAGLPRRARVARGELRAEGGRCAEAALDFNGVLASSGADEAAARSLYGLASCALLAGDEAAASAALTRYVADHPQGAQVTSARAALARLLARSQTP